MIIQFRKLEQRGVGIISKHRTFSTVLRLEWRWWIPGAAFSFILASLLMSGWPTGILPNVSYPYTYTADGLIYSWMSLRTIEGGWIFDNPRSGFPFGSNFLDYPGSDAGNILLLKTIGTATGEYYSAINLFFLLSFSAVFLSSFCTLRTFGLTSPLSFSASLLFSFLAFHFQRIEHVFYWWYFVAPIFFYFSYRFYSSDGSFFTKGASVKKILYVLSCFLTLASFGVYYALFGVIILSTTAFAIVARTGRFRAALPPILATSIVVLGVLINVSPNIVHKQIHDQNSEVAVRSSMEAEVYGLKFMQLLLPRADHRVPSLASLTQRYNSSYPLVNENVTAGLGAVGAAGFTFLFLYLLATLSGGKADPRLSLLSMLVLVLFLFGTIGGFGALFSAAISSSIRGWNRISVFIAFGSIAAFFLMLQIFIKHHFSENKSKLAMISCALIFGGIGLYDQTAPACLPCNEKTRKAFELDRNFVSKIEHSLPKNSSIYQLPYMPFPETAQLHELQAYALSVGFLHSESLRWSYAGMKGREGDLFFRALALRPIEEQVKTISSMGFSGIYIDRRGYKDNANSLIHDLSVLLGNDPSITRADGKVVFFQISPPSNPALPIVKSIGIFK